MKNLISYAIVIAIVIVLKMFVFTTVQVVGGSMDPTLMDGELMFLNKLEYKINEVKRFDIVVVENVDAGKLIVKRVIGLPGETVSYMDNELYIDGVVVEEPFTHGDTINYIPEETMDFSGYFLVGDNRGISRDSRNDGSYAKDTILGKTSVVFFPFSKMGIRE